MDNMFDHYNAHRQLFEPYIETFLALNHKVNLLSRLEEHFLWEKHIVDSLALSYFIDKFNYDYRDKLLLDIGTGGGLPAIPLAIYYPELKVIALDSIGKKIRAVNTLIEQLSIPNAEAVLSRAEHYPNKADIVTTRAVAPLIKLLPVVANKISDNGFFIAYKGSKAEEELQAARPHLAKLNLVEKTVIPYPLPLEGDYQRNLIILQKHRATRG